MFITLTSIFGEKEDRVLVNLANITTISPYDHSRLKSSIYSSGNSFITVIETIEEIGKKIENTRLREGK